MVGPSPVPISSLYSTSKNALLDTLLIRLSEHSRTRYLSTTTFYRCIFTEFLSSAGSFPSFYLRNCLKKKILRFISIEPIKDMSLKKRRRVWKGNRKGQLLKICVRVSETAPLIRLYGS